MRKADLTNGYKSITANKLRSAITISLITMGISAMVAIKSSIGAIEEHLAQTYTNMGTSITHITGKEDNPIRNFEVEEFCKHYKTTRKIGIFSSKTFTATAQYKEKTTPPLCQLCAANGEYITISNYKLAKGRNFTQKEVEQGGQCCIIGNTIAEQLFGEESPLFKKIKVSGVWLTVIGTISKEGDNSKGGIDNQIVIPWYNNIFYDNSQPLDYQIILEDTENRAEAIFSKIRNLSPGDKKDYNIERSEMLIEEFEENISLLEKAATIISIVTLIGATIGLMNIMLIQVGEKQREFGVRKAIGAKNSDILNQVLTEAILLSLIGSLLGIITGSIISLLISRYLECPFHISWSSIFSAIVACLCVGIISGYYPAKKGATETIVDSLKAR